MSHKSLQEPHVLLASSNPHKLMRNLAGTITSSSLARIKAEIDKNVIALFRLGELHFNFANSILDKEWRQKVSRLYYGAYNIHRSVMLDFSGQFSTESKDHQTVGTLPDSFPNVGKYRIKLRNLHDDRNLADYSHVATEKDLLIGVVEAVSLVDDFAKDSRTFLISRGVPI